MVFVMEKLLLISILLNSLSFSIGIAAFRTNPYKCLCSSLKLSIAKVEDITENNLTGLKAKKRILLLGGSGFVGSKFIEEYRSHIINSGCDYNVELVSLSRRGLQQFQQSVHKIQDTRISILSVQGDATNGTIIADVFSNYGPFDGCVHAMGLLLDSQSGSLLMKLNKYASGSGSEVTQESTYDKVTRQSAFSVMEALTSQPSRESGSPPPVFVFLSAAEAGWKVDPPVDWLRRYLLAKRQVESQIFSIMSSSTPLRGVIFRSNSRLTFYLISLVSLLSF